MSSKNLVIVESPAKAKTIEKYLGKDYRVLSSFGHIRDLPKKGLSIDKDKGFEPTYEIPADKKKVVSELKKEAKSADVVWLASDEDREGEAIAWHLSEALSLDPKKTKRIVFHEITKPAIEHAVQNPRSVDINTVNAQQARRILDRLVGYELSPVLWKKVQRGLSAGRVQSVAVRIIVEREREIKAHDAESDFKVTALFRADGEEFKAELSKRFSSDAEAETFIRDCMSSEFRIADIVKKDGSRNPGAPFTTSTLQQEAARRLGYSVKQTMTLAQRLYEAGHITYMRTDSTNLSALAIDAAKDYVTKVYGKEYSRTRQFKTKNSSAQEAHEAIRPTNFDTTSAGEDEKARKLYNLIWSRALASQMSPARLAQTTFKISISNRDEEFISKGEILLFKGFMEVYGKTKDDTILPELKKGDVISRDTIEAHETFSKPPARFSEASLVKALEEMGIGRPSTYAPTISTIIDRGYVEKQDLEGDERTARVILLKGDTVHTEEVVERYGADRNKLVTTYLADMTTDFLVKYFSDIVDYDFTARVEERFDTIEDGNLDWRKMLEDFYASFHPLVEASADVSRSETSQARLLGHDPKDGQPVYARFGRFGPMIQKGEVTDEDKKPAFATMPTGATLNTVTLEQALEMFKLPREVGKTEDGKIITANIGRFGPYIQIEKTYVSIKPLDPLSISETEARSLYKEKLEKDANRIISDFGEIKVLRGPFGPYVTNGKKNARIPKTTEPETLTESDCFELLQKAPEKRSRKRKK